MEFEKNYILNLGEDIIFVIKEGTRSQSNIDNDKSNGEKFHHDFFSVFKYVLEILFYFWNCILLYNKKTLDF